LIYDGAFQSIAALPDMLERTIISDGASKTWAMTGWRIGYAVNRTLAPTFTRWVTNTESCASHISQWAAVEALNGPQDAAEMMKASFLKRRDLIVGLLNQVPGISCLTPGGAFYAWPNVTEACRMTGCADSEVFRKKLLTEAGVTSAPASPAKVSTSAFPTRPRKTPSRAAWRASRTGCARTP
ncbi:unnamed protein product, partial [Phaeothamnion confervicola]